MPGFKSSAPFSAHLTASAPSASHCGGPCSTGGGPEAGPAQGGSRKQDEGGGGRPLVLMKGKMCSPRPRVVEARIEKKGGKKVL